MELLQKIIFILIFLCLILNIINYFMLKKKIKLRKQIIENQEVLKKKIEDQKVQFLNVSEQVIHSIEKELKTCNKKE